nr:uncharacterized protein LOC101241910 isoform X3 [Ciona intestinalis]|eukprot:XP_026692427.1 uncharacterized protein LOC101241910 isoform X3 [Ciona intestinalis]
MLYILLVVLTALAVQNVRCDSYKWKFTLMEVTNSTLAKIDVLDGRNVLKIASYTPPLQPQNIKHDLQQIFEKSSHVVKIDVVNSQDEISYTVMHHLQSNAIPPYLFADYISHGHSYDGGNAQYKIAPTVVFSDTGTETSETDISWLYPLPLTEYSSQLILSAPEPHTEGFTISPLRKSYHILHHEHLEAHNTGINADETETINLFQQVSTVAVKNSVFAFSGNEFENSHLKKIPLSPSDIVCTSSVETVIVLNKHIYYFSKHGVHQLPNYGYGSVISRVKVETDEILCAQHVSTSTDGFQANTILVSSANQMFMLEMKDSHEQESSLPGFVVMKDGNGKDIFNFLNRSPENCTIVSHIVGNQKCCVMFFLLFDSSTEEYIIARYAVEEMHEELAEWRFETKFSNQLPAELDGNYGFVFLVQSEDHADEDEDHGDEDDDHEDEDDDHADEDDDHADEDDDHADEDEDHADEDNDHADEGEDHADEGEDHADEDEDHADEDDDHADEDDDHTNEDEDDDHADEDDDHADEDDDHADEDDDHGDEDDVHGDEDDDHAEEESGHGHGHEESEGKASGHKREFVLKGLSDIFTSDGSLYLWGDVVLAYDLRTTLLALIPAGRSYTSLGNVQFTSTKFGAFSVLTSNGDIWQAVTGAFYREMAMKKNPNNATLLAGGNFSNILGLFYDSFNDLYLLAIVDSKIERIFVSPINSSVHEDVILIMECPRLVGRERKQVFYLNPPTNAFMESFDGQLPSAVYTSSFNSTKHISSYITLANLVHIKQNIGKQLWWNKIRDWNFDETGFDDYVRYLSINSIEFLKNHQAYSLNVLDIIRHDHTEHVIDCSIPDTIYFDKGDQIRLSITLTHGGPHVVLPSVSDLLLFASVSENNAVHISITREAKPTHAVFQVVVTGLQLEQHSPGVHLQLATIFIWPWYPQKTAESRGVHLHVKVGCPPGMSLEFDSKRSIEILASRGRTDNFECPSGVEDGIPCFTTSEFVTAFYMKDHVYGKRFPFVGNYTLRVVGGGVGYLENVRNYTQEEIAQYNYRPGNRDHPDCRIWSAITPGGMQDNETGELIFNSMNPPSIVFECRLLSPCGSIPFGQANPSGFYLVIETSTRGVDTSSNCDFTMRFVIHLIGIELNAKSHLYIMITTFAIISTFIILFYQFTDGSGRILLDKLLSKRGKSVLNLSSHNVFRKVYEKNAHSSTIAAQYQHRGSVGGSLLGQTVQDRSRSIALVSDLRRKSVSQNRIPDIMLTSNADVTSRLVLHGKSKH